jgi:group I intron endonuclease
MTQNNSSQIAEKLKNKPYFVYCYTNKINGKVYIGKTNNISQRKSRHRRNAFIEKSTLPFYNALRKYSEDGFDFSILDQFDQEYVIFDLEIFYIKALNASNRNFGYNLTAGGEGSSGTKHNAKQIATNKLRVGIKNGNSKLNDSDILSIFNEYKSGISAKDLTIKYNVSAITIERLLSGKSWKHLNLDIAALDNIKKINMSKYRSFRWIK